MDFSLQISVCTLLTSLESAVREQTIFHQRKLTEMPTYAISNAVEVALESEDRIPDSDPR